MDQKKLRYARLALAVLTPFVWIQFVEWRVVVGLLVAISVHEFGHWVLVKYRNMEVKAVMLTPMGALVAAERCRDGLDAVYIASGGPLASVLMALVLLVVNIMFFDIWWLNQYAYAIAIFDLINLLPLPIFDGGHMMNVLVLGFPKWIQRVVLIMFTLGSLGWLYIQFAPMRLIVWVLFGFTLLKSLHFTFRTPTWYWEMGPIVWQHKLMTLAWYGFLIMMHLFVISFSGF